MELTIRTSSKCQTELQIIDFFEIFVYFYFLKQLIIDQIFDTYMNILYPNFDCY